MSVEIINAFVEGRGSLASLERAIAKSENPLMARAEFEKELAAELAFKNIFATIPPPPQGLSRVMAALRSLSAPVLSEDDAETLSYFNSEFSEESKAIPEPAGGYSSAISRLKSKLAATPVPVRSAELDILPSIEPATPATRKTRRLTRKIVRMPQGTRSRDVLAAGKDLPENPNDLPPAL